MIPTSDSSLLLRGWMQKKRRSCYRPWWINLSNSKRPSTNARAQSVWMFLCVTSKQEAVVSVVYAAFFCSLAWPVPLSWHRIGGWVVGRTRNGFVMAQPIRQRNVHWSNNQKLATWLIPSGTANAINSSMFYSVWTHSDSRVHSRFISRIELIECDLTIRPHHRLFHFLPYHRSITA